MKPFTFTTKIYLSITYLAGILIFVMRIGQVNFKEPWMLISLCILASLALILKVEGSTNRSHYTFSFLVYGFSFAIFGPAEAIVVIVVSNIAEWIWNRPPWFIQLFNTGSYILVMELAGIVYNLINPLKSADTWQTVLAILISMATFDLLNHLMVGVVIWLARGENFYKSGVFEIFPLLLDLTLLCFGASLSFVWTYNPFALTLFLIPLYLIYFTLRVPALERKSETDSKTGLFNHEYLKKQLDNELSRANRFDRPLSMIMADLDLLRNINNTYGHQAGDEVLIGISKILKSSVREYDIVARFGGEEFAILLPETTLSQAFERSEIIRRKIEEMEFSVPTSVTPIGVTMSFGVSQRENFSQTSDELIYNADMALYHSKLTGRNRAFAYENETYVNFNSTPAMADQTSLLKKSRPPEKLAVAPALPVSQHPEKAIPSGTDMEVKSQLKDETQTVLSKTSDRAKSPKHAASIFIASLAVVSVAFFLVIYSWMDSAKSMPVNYDWLGLGAIAVLIALSEWFSLDLYARQSSISTSAIPILVAFLVFGPIGTVIACLVLSVSLVVKYRSQFSRFIFNLSNHLLAGSLCLGLLMLTNEDYLNMSPLFQIIFALLSAAILYITTTWMIAFGMSLTQQQSALQIWKEQYVWLAPLYAGIGVIAYALIFGYRYDHIVGILLMVVPMAFLRVSQKQYLDRTREIVVELREKNQALKKTSEEIVDLNESLLGTLSEIIDIRDPYVLGHSKQVSYYATEIAKIMKLSDRQIELVRKGSLLHDIGKLGIAEEILRKPTRLSKIEYEEIKRHAIVGAELVEKSPSLRMLVPIIRQHHEFYDGEGYPDQLRGAQISIEARIVAVADAIDAMSSDRPYRKMFKPEVIMEEIKKYSGSQFDPLVVEAALKMLEVLSADQPVSKENTEHQTNAVNPMHFLPGEN